MHQLLALLTSQEIHLVVQSTIPDRFINHIVPGANHTFYSFQSGIILWQEIEINGFIFGYSIFEITTPASLRFTCNSDSGILHYVLKGKLDFNVIPAAPILLLNEQQYCLGYHPSGSELDIYFAPGEHHYFQLSLSVHLLQHLLQSADAATAFDSGFSASTTGIFHTYVLPITKKTANLVHNILHPGTGPASELLYLNDCALKLTSRFITDTNKYYRKYFWQRKKQLRLDELELYILDHLDTDSKKRITATACANRTGMNLHAFKNLFFQHYQLSLPAFIRKKRMEKAMQLITGSALSVGEIYLKVGFEDFSSFTRAFQRYHGSPPSFYRNE